MKKREREIVDKILSYLYAGKHRTRINVCGQFHLSEEAARLSIMAHLDGDSRGLEEHEKIWRMYWDAQDIGQGDSYVLDKTLEFWDYAKTSDAFWVLDSVLDKEQIAKIDRSVNRSKAYREYINSYEYRKRIAKQYTSNRKIRATVFDRDGKVCKHCGGTTSLSLDHIVPVSRGGGNTLENIQVLCKPCNSKKGNKINT